MTSQDEHAVRGTDSERLEMLGALTGELMRDMVRMVEIVRNRAAASLADVEAGRAPVGGLEQLDDACRELGSMLRHTMALLRDDAAMPAFTYDPAARPSSDTLPGCRLLIIDDDPSVRQALSRLLARIGAEVLEYDPVETTDDGLVRALISAMPEVILLDLRLAGRNGVEIWATLAAHIPDLARKVVFLTGTTPGEPDWVAAQRTGQPVLSKPVDVHELAEVVARIRNRE